MTLRPALARFERGFRRMGGSIIEWAWERPQAALARQTLLQWRSQRRRTREVIAETRTAIKAALLDTPDGDMQLGLQRPAFNDEIDRLLRVPKRSREEDWRLLSLQRQVRAIDEIVATRGATPETVGHLRMRRFAGLPAVAGFALRPWMLWTAAIAIVALWGGYNDVRAGRAENQRDEALADLVRTERDLVAAATERDLLAQRASAADAQSAQTASNIEAERRRRVAVEAELRRIRRAMDQAGSDGPIDYGFGSVRGDDRSAAPASNSDGAPTGNPG